MTDFNPPNSSSQNGSEATFWTFDAVEERLIEALLVLWRLPDREAGWQRVRSLWPELKQHGWRVNVGGEFSEPEAAAETRPARVTRGEIGEMERTVEWLAWVADDAQRRALVLGLVERARGKKRVGWAALVERIGEPGLSSAALEYRYSRAITFIANVLNALAGHPYRSRKGAVAAWPKAVSDVVGRAKLLKSGAEACQGRNVN